MYIAHASSLYTWYLLRIVLNCLLLSSFHYSILLNSILLFYFISLLPSFFPLLSPLPLFYFPSVFSPSSTSFLSFILSLSSLPLLTPFPISPLLSPTSCPSSPPLVHSHDYALSRTNTSHYTLLSYIDLLHSAQLKFILFYSTLLNLF